MADLRLLVEGPAAEAAAGELTRLIEAEFGSAPTMAREQPPSDQGRRGDPVAIAALVLSVPGAILATMDLAQRVKLKEKISRLIALARGLQGKATVRLDTATGPRDLGALSPDEAIDFLARPGT